MSTHHVDWSWSVQMDFIGFFAGDLLGSGDSRHVYVFNPDPRFVLKVHHTINEAHFTNIAEWDIWSNVKTFKPISKWLAPCSQISANGHVLLMRRVEPLPDDFEMPKKVPNCLADFGRRNWGLYKGRPVMCDYGNHRFFSEAKKNFKMVKPRKGDSTTL